MQNVHGASKLVNKLEIKSIITLGCVWFLKRPTYGTPAEYGLTQNVSYIMNMYIVGKVHH